MCERRRSYTGAWRAVGFGLFAIQALCGLQEKLNLYGFKRKLNPAIVGSAENACVEQSGYVAVYCLHVSMSAAGGLTN